MKTAVWQKVYERLYSAHKDVSLFWKTQNLYYVKSQNVYRNLEVTVQADERDVIIAFEIDKDFHHAPNNTKKELLFVHTKGLKRPIHNRS